ncbi:MAG TPA: hypothetical protein VNA17_06020 [Pyrinomonadaceae bacterium]|nr:hypothetical protein [Pyrinomonadaceae bacterium]
MNLSGAKKLAIRSTAGFMSVWLSGVMFLFCCAEMNAAAPPIESDHSAQLSSHCDKAPVEHTAGDIASPSDEGCFDCCGFIPLVFDKARKIERDQKQLVAIVRRPAAFRHEILTVTTRARHSFGCAGHHPNKQGSYLINRALRI